MNQDLDNTAYLAGDFISEDAVRGALQRRRQVKPEHASASQPAEIADAAASRAGRSQRLRRWSVAELIAGAVARPPTGGVAH